MNKTETVACDQWYDYYLKGLVAKGMDDATAVGQANALWLKIQAIAEVRPVEQSTVALITKCQLAGYKVMGLTARPVGSVALTKRQLESAGIDFLGSPVYDKEIAFKLISNAKYSKGVLFIDELNKKGESLSYFLKRIKFTPKKIVFADDKRKHSENMDLEMGKLGIPFVGFQSTRTYERAKRLDFSLSDIQLEYLGKILPDSMAKIFLENATRSVK